MRLAHCRGLAIAAVCAAAFASAPPLLAQDLVLNAHRVDGSAGPLGDPEADYWKSAVEVHVPMEAQVMTNPQNADPAVKELSVRAVHNGQWFAFLIEWADPTKSDRLVGDQFGDQVAVEMPTTYKPGDYPNPMMGGPGERVHIMQWRAALQHDIDNSSEPTIKDLYPFASVDVYPHEVLRVSDARAYKGAMGLENPISRPSHSPVLDHVAEGFGTLTAVPEQQSNGRGIWSDGRWRVVITHPMAVGDPNNAVLAAGGETLAAFAVWEGGAKEVGSRKAWSNWVQLKLEGSQ